MITEHMINRAKREIIQEWKEDGEKVIEETSKVVPFNGDSGKFLDNCFAQGGNWTGMLLSGIRNLYPKVWEVIPDSMGEKSWLLICDVLILCGVDTSK